MPCWRATWRGWPTRATRHNSLTLPGKPTGGPMGDNQVVYNDELVSGEVGQIGTQFDGLGHVGTRVGDEDIFYNGFRLDDIHSAYGLTKLGIENANGELKPGMPAEGYIEVGGEG